MKIMKIETAMVGKHRILRLFFTYDIFLIQHLRKIEGAYWNSGLRCWVVPHIKTVIQNLASMANELGWYMPDLLQMDNEIYFKKLNRTLTPEKEEVIESFTGYLRAKRYSFRTVTVYSEALRIFMEFNSDKELMEITEKDLVHFNTEYILPKRYSWSYQNQVISALKIYFREILKKNEEEIKLERPRSGRHLPEIFSVEEVEKLLQSIRNLKHQAAIALIYACGLRRSELIHLKLRDVDSKRKLLIIKGGKGDKDRVVPLPDRMIGMLRNYYKIYRPSEWLFEGNVKGVTWSETSLREVFIRAMKYAGIKKNLTLHSLRHTYATHLLENGIDLRFIQVLLGHRSSRTTEIYTHVMARSIDRIKSPFENLNL